MSDGMSEKTIGLTAGARERLQEIADAAGGILKPDDVVADAKDKSSPLHGYFTWDVKQAARERWTDQARSLIRSVQVVIHNETHRVTAVAYVRDPSSDSDQQGYVSTSRIRTEADAMRDVLEAELDRVESALKRAADLADYFDMAGQVNAIRARVRSFRERVVSASTGLPKAPPPQPKRTTQPRATK